jgi:hypothetical protein
MPLSPELLERLIGGEVEWVDGGVQEPFVASAYED